MEGRTEVILFGLFATRYASYGFVLSGVVAAETRPGALICDCNFIGHVVAREVGKRMRGGDLHLHVDGLGAHDAVEGSAFQQLVVHPAHASHSAHPAAWHGRHVLLRSVSETGIKLFLNIYRLGFKDIRCPRGKRERSFEKAMR